MESLIPIVVVPTVFAFILLIGPFRQPLTRWINRKADGGEGGMMLREELRIEPSFSQPARRFVAGPAPPDDPGLPPEPRPRLVGASEPLHQQAAVFCDFDREAKPVEGRPELTHDGHPTP